MGEQTPQMQVDEKELAVIQRTFKDNDELLKSMRAVMLNLSPSDGDKKLVTEVFADDALYALVYKRFLPTLSKDSPIGQASDVWLGAEQMVFGQSESAILQAIEYKERSIEMTQKALEALRDSSKIEADVIFSARKYLNDPWGINLLSRNQFIRHIESQLLFLKLIAAQVKADPKTAGKNSGK
jgi:hypothetical protein